MKDEIAKIIVMVQEGKIDSEEAGELIQALKEDSSPASSSGSYLGKMLKIRVKSDTQENVRVNIPVRFVRFLLKMGHGIAANIPEAKEYVKDIDVDLIMHAIDQEMEGKIVDIESDDGETVAIYIE
ncbi:hypothetical protein ACFSKI_12345 [Pseudogracilibacillus auburnensis]|uniref:YvlB/LiaX N-terminal domain-containing protein n=1 Tax=Pseudogracilibacillus auburnensis TaxID=1494959 RepID=A0A2V3WB81_9BACI|nr:hypothetical protein [Pseudogracilibacillus auburnensis]PXW90271.1 hypothetical protein DFR56_101182 [Pseudogracilibacillus auburnensis]